LLGELGQEEIPLNVGENMAVLLINGELGHDPKLLPRPNCLECGLGVIRAKDMRTRSKIDTDV